MEATRSVCLPDAGALETSSYAYGPHAAAAALSGHEMYMYRHSGGHDKKRPRIHGKNKENGV